MRCSDHFSLRKFFEMRIKVCNKNAIILLHEIYGVNQYIKELSYRYASKGFDVYYPDMLGGRVFSYDESTEAYEYFTKTIGFDVYREINSLASKIRNRYEMILLIGFSIGATVAYRCTEDKLYDGAICYYGSRIRDYIDVQPNCPVLLIFADQDSFNVDFIIDQLKARNGITVYKLNADHGFMDFCSDRYNKEQSKISKSLEYAYLTDRLKKLTGNK